MDEDIKKIISQRRYVQLTGSINENTSDQFISNLLKLEMSDPMKDILVIINSYGGLIHSAWAMIDTMNLVNCNIHTLVIGKAISAASLILMNGTKGKRYSTKHSSIMMHKLQGETSGNIDHMFTDINETRRMQKEIESYIIEKTNIIQEDLDKMIINDCYLTPTKAQELGIIDRIIDKFSDIKLESQ